MQQRMEGWEYDEGNVKIRKLMLRRVDEVFEKEKLLVEKE